MLLKKALKSRKAVSNVISVLLITGIMITSIAITYTYLIPTVERAQTNATLTTSALFMTKMDGAIQSLISDGNGSSRYIDIDAFAGDLEFINYGLNFRAFVDGNMYFPIPGISYGSAILTVTSEVALMTKNTIEYIKGDPADPIAVTDVGNIDPAIITLERPQSDLYIFDLWYRTMISLRDTGDDGTIDVTVTILEFSATQSIRGLNSGTYGLSINKINTEINPDRYGFTDNDPVITDGDDFAITLNIGTGPFTYYTSTGYRSRISINLLVQTIHFIPIIIE
ncbi:MAG: hypothetical protein FK734_05525 [Asgard group archaeon]|nr:hypothetical protein [Asgard group archaeon]